MIKSRENNKTENQNARKKQHQKKQRKRKKAHKIKGKQTHEKITTQLKNAQTLDFKRAFGHFDKTKKQKTEIYIKLL